MALSQRAERLETFIVLGKVLPRWLAPEHAVCPSNGRLVVGQSGGSNVRPSQFVRIDMHRPEVVLVVLLVVVSVCKL